MTQKFDIMNHSVALTGGWPNFDTSFAFSFLVI